VRLGIGVALKGFMLDLTWWQVFALIASAAISVLGGRLLGSAIHRMLYRHVLLTRSRVDDSFVLRLAGPFEAAGIVLVWQLLISLIDLPPAPLAFCRNVGHIGLLLALGFGAMRMVDTAVEHIQSRQRWIADQRLSTSLLPLARRIVKIALGAVVAVMVLARMGYAVGPILVLIAITGGCLALAAHRPVENVLAAYALLGDHGIREGDRVTLDTGATGVIEQVGLYSTRLRTTSNTFVIVPNRKLADAQIERSFKRPQTRPLAVVQPPHAVNE
jgi:small-conductance mechanosensitive channel